MLVVECGEVDRTEFDAHLAELSNERLELRGRLDAEPDGLRSQLEALDTERMDAGIAKLLETNEPKVVALYLHVFNLQQESGWENLSERLANNPQLALA